MSYFGVGDFINIAVYAGSRTVSWEPVQGDAAVIEAGVTDEPGVRRPPVGLVTMEDLLCNQGNKGK